MRQWLIALSVLASCRGLSPEADGGVSQGNACKQVVPMTDSGTCPVMPPNGVLCDLTEVASGLCGAPGCPSNDCHGCSSKDGTSCSCGYGGDSVQVCFPLCESSCDPNQTPQNTCVALGSCSTATDCQGTLPHICNNCPLSPNGQGSKGCAHWICNQGRCDIGFCEPGPTCPGGSGCPSYYLPPVDRTCAAATDCALVDHAQSCCTTVKTAVRVGQQGRFAELESQCAAIREDHFCGCAGSTVTEDGDSPGPGQDFEAACIGGTCKAIVGGRLQCGTTSCDPGQVCCTSAGPDGHCLYTCATSCPIMLDDAGIPFATACMP